MFNLDKPSFFFLDLLIFANSQYNTIQYLFMKHI